MTVLEQILNRRLECMEEERLKILHHENNLNICIDFFARMIEKYGPELDVNDIEDTAFNEMYYLKKDGA